MKGYSTSLKHSQPTTHSSSLPPHCTTAHLCPLTLMLLTLLSLKSHSRLGYRKGAMKPPEAASTWIGTHQPVSRFRASAGGTHMHEAQVCCCSHTNRHRLKAGTGTCRKPPCCREDAKFLVSWSVQEAQVVLAVIHEACPSREAPSLKTGTCQGST